MKSDINNPIKTRNIIEDTIDLKKYFFVILANWHWFVISVLLGLSIAWLTNRYTKPVYLVKTSLIVSESTRGGNLTGYENMIPGMEIYRNQKLVLNEIEILKSYSLAKMTLDSMDFGITYMGVGRSGFKENVLYKTCPFVVIPDSSKTNVYNYNVYIDILSKTHYEITIDDKYNLKERVAFGNKFSSAPFNFTIILKDSSHFDPAYGFSKYYFRFNHINSMVNEYKNRLSISVNDDKRGSVLYLSFTEYQPQKACDYLNKLSDVYIKRGLKEKNQTAINTVNFIDAQLRNIDTTLKAAEKNLQDFRLTNRIVDIGREGNVVYDRLVGYQNELAMIELKSQYLKYFEKYVKDNPELSRVIVPENPDFYDPLISQLIKELNELLAEKGELMFSVSPENSKVVLLQTKIDKIRSELVEITRVFIKNNDIKYNETNRQLKLAEIELNKLPVNERKLINIQRDYEVNDQIYTYLLEKKAEAGIAEAANVPDNKVLDIALADNAMLILPRIRTNYTLGLLIGFFFPLALLIFLDLFNNKISSRSEIEAGTSVPIISAIGHNEGKGDIPIIENPKSPLAESFRGLRTNLQYLLKDNNQKIIAITSTVSGEGKTFCSINLAAIYALAGKKTLLIGLDLRKPKINKIFNLDSSKGISTCLIGKTTLNEVISDSRIDNLFVAPSGPIPPNPAELLESDAMTELLIEARKNYDIIILDTPPFAMVTDALIIARQADLTLFILRQNYSTKRVLELFEDIYQKKELRHIGIILNDIKQKGYYGFGYRYYNYAYAYQYGYYNNYGNYNEEKN